MAIRRLIITVMLIWAVLLVSGCATLGPQYSKVEQVPVDRGLVYIYRPASFVGGGVSYDVHANQDVVTTLYNGGYYPYLSKPGEMEFWASTESKSSITLDVKPGETYFVKGEVGVGFLVGRPHLMVVARETGEREITACKLIPDKSP